MDPIIAAVDPGLSGAIAWLRLRDRNVVQLLGIEDIPVVTAKSGKTEKSHVNLPELARSLSAGWGLYEPNALVVEEVHAMPGQGVTSMFRFGYVAGAIAGVAAGLAIPTHTIRPQLWQKVARVKAGPDAGRLRASQLFPNHSTLFARKKDHNRADAALIGYAFLCDDGPPLLTI